MEVTEGKNGQGTSEEDGVERRGIEGIVEVRDNGGKGIVGASLRTTSSMRLLQGRSRHGGGKRKKRRAHGLERAKDRPARGGKTKYPNLSTTELREQQGTDEMLSKVVEGNRVFKSVGVLYKYWVPQGQLMESAINQIVLPKKFHSRAPYCPLESTRRTPWEEKESSEDPPPVLLADFLP